jgi:hypothetical protein
MLLFLREPLKNNYCRLYPQRYDEFSNSNTLFETFLKNNSNSLTIRESILKTLEDFGQTNIPEYLIDSILTQCF